MDFREADRRYTDLKRRYDNGDLSDEEFRTQLELISVQDGEDRWWVKHRDTGAWYYQDGDTWVPGTPYRESVSEGGASGPSEPKPEQPEEPPRISVQQTPGWWTPEWWIPVGIASVIAGLIGGSFLYSPVLGILLPLVGMYSGYRAVQIGKTVGGIATLVVSGIVCLYFMLWLLL
jgi:hypothetical protein